MKDDLMPYLEKRLEQWAEWFSQNHNYGLGFPPCSTEYILMTSGGRASKGSPGFLPCNEEAEEIEDLVKEMAMQNFNMALALRCHYFTSGGLRAKAKSIHVSHMHYKTYVDMAHQWLAGRLTAYDKYRH